MPPHYLSPDVLVAETVENLVSDRSKNGEAIVLAGTEVFTYNFPKPQNEALKFILSDEGFKIADPHEAKIQLQDQAKLLAKNLEE